MAKSKILIVDDEKEVCEVIQDRLRSLGYETRYVLNGLEALDAVKKERLDLILLDILMPGMDGYEVSKRLINHEGVSTIPIIMLTALNSQRDKLKALTMGIDDYVTKPFDFDELVARIEAVLRRSQKEKASEARAPSKGKSLSVEDGKRLQLLKDMIQQKVQKIIPEYNLNSQSGYAYPFAAKIFANQDGSEILHLDVLTQRQCLMSEFFDRVLLCPFCKNYNLNIRETCLTCHSPHLKMVEMIHHFRCAYTGMEEEFKQGIDYVCPKCHHELKSIGVDYDKPGQNYYCEACHDLSIEASTGAQCRHCLQIFLIENALRQNIYAYQLTQQAYETVESGQFISSGTQDSWMDEEVDVYNLRYLRSLLSQEIKQAGHFKRPLSLVLLTFENFNNVLREQGEAVAKKIFKAITELFKENLRDVDIPARFQENSLIAMMVECDKKLSLKILQKIHSAIEEKLQALYGNILLTLKTVSFPEDANNEETLLKKLLESSPV